MLPELDEYPAVCLEHLERSQGAPLVARLEDMLPLFCVVERVALVERRSVAAAASVSAPVCPYTGLIPYSLMHRTRVEATLPVRSTAPYPCLTSSPTDSSMAAAPPPAVARSTAARRRGLALGFGGADADEGPAVAYCLEGGARGKLGLGSCRGSCLGRWLRQRAHVQPAPRGFERRDEKVGFSIVSFVTRSC